MITRLTRLFDLDDVPLSVRRDFAPELRHYALWVLLAGTIEANLNAIVARKTFGASPALTTFVWSIPILANILNMWWATALRGKRRIPAMVMISGATAVLVGGLAYTPAERTTVTIGPFTETAGAWLFALQLSAIYVLWSGLITLRVSLWGANYPATQRAQITGRMQNLRNFGMLIAPAALGLLYDWDPYAYRFVYPGAALVGLLSLVPLSRIRVRRESRDLRRTRAARRDRRRGGTLREAAQILQRDRAYRHYLTAQFLLGSSNFFTDPVLVIVLTTQFGLDYLTSVLIMSSTPSLVILLTTLPWARFFDRHGIIAVRIWNSGLWMVAHAGVLAAMLMLYVAPDATALALTIIIATRICAGVAKAGGMLAWPLGHLAFARRDDDDLYLGLNVALTGVRGLLMPQTAAALQVAIGNFCFGVPVILCGAAHAMYRAMRPARRDEG